ncbi:cyclin-K [Seiridium cupressi]
MASIDRYRPPGREAYQPPSRPVNTGAPSRPSKSPTKRRDVPPAVPSPPTHLRHPTRSSSPKQHSSQRSTGQSTSQTTPDQAKMAENQWIFTDDEVLGTPSIIEGLHPAEERLRRAKGVNFIYQAGALLQLPQTTLYVAGVYFHRFYMRIGLAEERGGIHHYNIAATALFLANKTEENCRKTKDIIIAVARVAQKNAKLIIDEQSKDYWRWRDSILHNEEIMLEKLTFDLMIDNPYSQLYKSLERIGCIHNKALRHAAWAFLNDSCLTHLPLLMDARDIAIGSIFFSSIYAKEQIDDINGKSWWVYLEADESKIARAVEVLRAFYHENPLRKSDKENPYQGSPEFKLDHSRKAGDGSSTNPTPLTDRGTQSPKVRTNGTDSREAVSAAAEEASQAPGDSDVALKEAANNPAIHSIPNGNGLVSPSKRRDVESLSETREQKRQRMSSDDEVDTSRAEERNLVSSKPTSASPSGTSSESREASKNGEIRQYDYVPTPRGLPVSPGTTPSPMAGPTALPECGSPDHAHSPRVSSVYSEPESRNANTGAMSDAGMVDAGIPDDAVTNESDDS